MAKAPSFLLWSDFHAHNWKPCSKLVNDETYGPINSRLLDAVNIIRQIGAYATKHKIKTVCFAGDLFHVPETTPTDVVSVIYQELEQLSKTCKLLMIPGNHDMAGKSGLHHALIPFKQIAEVYTSSGLYKLDEGTNLHLVPYREDKEEWKKELQAAIDRQSSNSTDILISHIGVQGAKVGSEYVLVSDQDVAYEDLQEDKWNAIFLGHFHEPQQLGQNAWYIGATNQHTWGDVDGERGFLHVTDGDEGITFKRIQTQAPKFVLVKTGKEKMGKDFVRILQEPGKPLPQIDAANLRHVEIKNTVPKQQKKAELALSPMSAGYGDILKLWVEEHFKGPSAEKDKVLNLGLELMAEVDDE